MIRTYESKRGILRISRDEVYDQVACTANQSRQEGIVLRAVQSEFVLVPHSGSACDIFSIEYHSPNTDNLAKLIDGLNP